jgi:hypothetical protein
MNYKMEIEKIIMEKIYLARVTQNHIVLWIFLEVKKCHSAKKGHMTLGKLYIYRTISLAINLCFRLYCVLQPKKKKLMVILFGLNNCSAYCIQTPQNY